MTGSNDGGSAQQAGLRPQAPGPVAEAVARVEAELAAFWSTPDETDGAPVVKTRASTMNLVAVGTRAEVEALEDQAEALAETHAGRSLLVTVDGHLPPWEMQADWSATCRRDGEVPICRDRVELTFGAVAAERAASVVGALAISEVPLVVEIARGAPPALADALAAQCDRLIVDSAEIPPARIAELLRKSRGPVADRAFVRTFSWRELLARFFDEAPGAWRAIRRVEIARSPGERPDPAAPLLGWLASRFGWTFSESEHGRAASDGGRALDAAGRPVEIALVEGTPGEEGARRRLDAVRISTEHRGAPLELACVRLDDAPNAVRWTLEGALTAAHVHPLGHREEAWVLTKAIDSTEGDAVLREALLAAAAWSAR